jgi:formyltetrahydrofolate hydrolase
MMQGNDLLVLARYMQILSEDFVAKWEMKLSIFTIHSYLLLWAQTHTSKHMKKVKVDWCNSALCDC